jgi:STE24 endopeptidase
MVTPFDPEAATGAYMATLSAAQHAKAIAYTQGREWLLMWGLLVDLGSAWIILRTGLLRRITARFGGGSRGVAACVAVFLALSWIITLPWIAYTAWWRERDYGLSRQPFGGWLSESVLSAVIGTLLSVLLALAIYALMRRKPRSWWAWSGGVAAAGIVFTVVLAPVLILPPSLRSPAARTCPPTRSISTTGRASRSGTPPTSRAYSERRGWR